ncbi:MaoC family dehydratase [Streptomyces sp. NPDC005065]|uniref:MaoC family dehydratase n=1 Tax=Streptomyces sp. NPDC005065 TaxID=3154461 RepID=UPI0033A32A42
MSAGRQPLTRTFASAEELHAAVGSTLGTSDWLEIDQHRIDLFAEATSDHQWVHVDPERAKEGPYGTTIAHGFLTLSLVVPLTSGLLQLDTAKMKLNYGLDRVRFLTPVTAGSRVRATAKLLAVDDTKTGLRTRMEITIELEGSHRPACVAETLVLIVPDTAR